MRAWGYERKLEKGKGEVLAKGCWEEMKERARSGKVIGGWKEKGKKFLEERKWKIEEMEILRERERGEFRGQRLRKRERRIQRKERWRRIEEAKFNR